MPDLLESRDYDLFDYKHADEPSLTLDEAVKKAAHLRSSDASHFHRILPTDSDMISFRIESVPREAVYSELLSRWSALLNRFMFRATRR